MQLLRIDWNVLFTIINLLILYFGLRKFLIKPVTNVMEQRRQMIEGQMADAKKTTEQANELKSQYEDALKQAHDESAHIVEKARKTAQAEYESRVMLRIRKQKKSLQMHIRPLILSVKRQCRIFRRRLQDLQ